MKTLDLKKDMKYLYAPSAKKMEIVDVPCLQFAMIDGAIEKGSEPGKSPSFAEATQALYGVSYTLKFMLKKRKTNAIDYPVMALEGLCMQTMHTGPYAAEAATVERMRTFAKEEGYQDCVGLGGKHHEIYLGDPRKADPAKLKTVLRHPIEKVK